MSAPRVIGFSALGAAGMEDFSLDHISALNYIPRIRVLPPRLPNGRNVSGFLYNLSGECSYEDADGTFVHVGPGGLVYLPCGSMHTYRALSDDLRHLRIHFRTALLPDGEPFVFSRGPLLLCETVPASVAEALTRIETECFSGADGARLRAVSALYGLLAEITAHHAPPLPADARLRESIRYLEENYTARLGVTELAQRCGFSESHYRRLFRAAKGVSPKEYVLRLRLEKACELLRARDSEISVGDIAEAVGFESLYYFSRMFRERFGVSPSQYR